MKTFLIIFLVLQVGCGAAEHTITSQAKQSRSQNSPDIPRKPVEFRKARFENTIHPHLSQTLEDRAHPYDAELLRDFEETVKVLNDNPKLSNGICYRMNFQGGKFILPGEEATPFLRSKTWEFHWFLQNNVASYLKKNKDFHFYYSPSDGGTMIQPEVVNRFHPKDIPYLFVEVPVDYYQKYSKNLHLLPDVYLIGGAHAESVKAVREARERTPFLERRDLAFWRGSQYGINWQHFDLENMDTAVRHQLVLKSLQLPDILNARYSQYDRHSLTTESQKLYQKALSYLFGDEPVRFGMPVARYMTYARYLVHVDGASASYERPFLIMHGGSVLLHTSNWVQFFNPLLEEGVHYLDIGSDLGRLESQVLRLRDHPELADGLIANGSEFVAQMTSSYFAELYISAFSDMQARF